MKSLAHLLPVSVLLLGLGNTAAAHEQIAGSLIGAGIGAAIGHSIDGRHGALIGSALGAVVGGAVSTGARGGYYAQPAGYGPVPGYPVAYHHPQPVAYYPQPIAYQQVTYVQPVAVRPVVYGPPAYVVPVGHGHGPRHGWHRRHHRWD